MTEANESKRLKALKAYQILDSEAEESYNQIVRLAAWISGIDYSTITLIDEDRQWFKATVGLPIRQTERSVAFCNHTIQSDALFAITDAKADDRFSSNPLVLNEPYIRSYFGIPLKSKDGCRLGALAVMGRKPGQLSQDKIEMLQALASQTMDLLEMRIQRIELEQTRKNLENAQRIAKIGSWELSLTDDKLIWSEETARIFGIIPDNFEQTRTAFLERVHPEDREEVTRIHNRLRKTGGSLDYRHRILFPNGEVRVVREKAEAILGPGGKVVGIAGTVHDVTEQAKAEEQVVEQGKLLDHTNDAVILRNLDNVILFWNRGAEHVYGWSKDEALGQSIEKLLYADPSYLHEATVKVIENGSWQGELQHKNRSGKYLTVQCRWTLVRDAKGKPSAILAINSDISEQKKLEIQFMRAQRMESIGTLAGGIAHDLNNLLSPILMGVDLLKQTHNDLPTTEILKNIEISAKRGADLVRQVLSFARGTDVHRTKLDPSLVIREIKAIVSNTFPKDIQLEVNLADNLWNLMADPTQLHQILLNLCLNARDAMPDGGELTITASNITLDAPAVADYKHAEAGPFVKIAVEDTGEGIPREIIERVFEPFFTTKEPTMGTGLGLSTVMGIVSSHKGFVTVYSEEGKGSNFVIYLPALSAAPNIGGEDIDAEQLPRGRGECILVVDDETSILEITRQTLEAFNYKVIPAEDGAQAIGLFAVHRGEIDAVITDMMMPVMDGVALIKAIHGIQPDLPILAASGLNSNGLISKAASLGIKDFLPKPYSADSLLKKLRKVLKKS